MIILPNRKAVLDLNENIDIETDRVQLVRDTVVIERLKDIITFLPMGTNLPLWTDFRKFVTFDLNLFNARALVIKENGNPVGQTVVFYADKKTLYFGFFGVSDGASHRIEFLIDELIKFGRKAGFETLKGPVNIPTIIFGWGFMEEGSATSKIVHKPSNLPIYPEIFRKKGFSEALKEHSYEGSFNKVPTNFTRNDLSNEYELVVFNSWEEIAAIKVEFLKLNVRNLDPRSVVTPSSADVFENYLGFIKQYGDPSIMVFALYKKTNKFIGCLVATPNPFDKTSCVFFTIGVDKKHRNKGIGWWMMEKLIDNCLKIGINSCIVIVGSHVIGGRHICERLGFKITRTHTVFTLPLQISVQDRLERISDVLSKKQNEIAFELLRELLEVDPRNDHGWLLLGIVYRRNGDQINAIKSFQEALRLNNGIEEAWGLLAITYLDKGQEDKAEECLSSAVLTNPTNEELKFYEENLIRIYNTFGPFF